ncbi:MAG: prolyl oligopeptidase family serine peptidase [Microthrixaceae bacterium]
MLAPPLSARSAVHGYGGGNYWVDGDTLYFVSSADQRIWRCDGLLEPVPVTPEPTRPRGLRHADGVATPDHAWIVCVQEAFPGESGVAEDATEAVNRLVAVPSTGGDPVVLWDGADFVSSPRIDPTGELLCWIAWRHPDMPWDRTELWVARLDRSVGDEPGATRSGVAPAPPRLVGARMVAGGPVNDRSLRSGPCSDEGEAIVEPRWDPKGRLWFVSDRSDWWNLYHFESAGPPAGEPVPVAAGHFEVSLPPWLFGRPRYAFLDGDRVVFAYRADGVDRLAVAGVGVGAIGSLDNPDRQFARIETPHTSIGSLVAHGSTVAYAGASSTAGSSCVTATVGPLGTLGSVRTLSRGQALPASSWLSVGHPITFPTTSDAVAHGIFHPPTNPDFGAPTGTRPPLIVTVHGGPTSSAEPELVMRTQFWTSRGFAVVEVDYRGSTGYGRRYRRALYGRWGVVDVADCAAAVRFLVGSGRVDGDRVAIRGSSAGGFTALAAVTGPDRGLFSAACALYGVFDLVAMRFDDHKFESRYLDNLVGPYPEEADTYRARSPLAHLDRLDVPLLLMQGTADPVVPASQTEALAAELAERGVDHEVFMFEGEGHGFRRVETIVSALEAERSFYLRVFDLGPP